MMRNDRRGFLAAGLAGLATLLGPKSSLAGFFHRHARARSRACAGSYPSTISYPAYTVHPRYNCLADFDWSPSNPTFGSHVTPSVPCTITVLGAKLKTMLAHGSPNVSISDQNNSNIHWGSFTNFSATAGTPYDTMTFNGTETGSSSGPSSLTITIALSGTNCGVGVWSGVPVTYT